MMLDDPAYRERLVAMGWKNADRYSLEEVTAQYAALYKEQLQKKKTND
jgi:hypothetical protein